MRLVKDDGGRKAAGFIKEANDCACRAIAIATERPYQEIYNALKVRMLADGPRGKRTGVEEIVQRDLMETLGWTWAPQRVHFREDELPSGRLVVIVHKHAAAVVNGVLHDTYDSSHKGTRWVYGYYKKGVDSHDSVLSADRKKLIDKITNLLALSDSSEFMAEASTARGKAAELIAKYDLAIGSRDLEKCEPLYEFRVGRLPSYEFTLLHAVGVFCGVLVISTPRQFGGRDLLFFGKPQDLVAFRYMRETVSAQQDRAWMNYLATHPGCGRQKASWKYSFATGAEEKVAELMRAAAVQQRAMRQDIVLVSRRDQAKAEYECLFGKLGSGSSYNGSLNRDGLEAGRNVSLSKGVNSGSTTLQIARRV